MAERANLGDGSLALYVHWPFCLSKCPYCDFNSHVRDHVDQARWQAALVRELDYYGTVTKSRTLGSIFFGGGTPSLMPAATVAAVIDRAVALWAPTGDIEITLEANPTSVEASKFKDLRVSGVNRVSLGVQALDDDALAFLGRGHSAREARETITLAERTFPRYSFDLIYARPGQTETAWRRELADAMAIAGDHLSVYQLTLEKGTPFYALARRGELVPPDEATAAALYESTQEALEQAGLPAYEVSNHARPGAECRHNIAYWLSGDYIGVGPGAHGRLADGPAATALEQIRAPEAWLDAVERQGHGTRHTIPVSSSERLEEMLMMGLRLKSGIPREIFQQRGGKQPEEALDPTRLDRLTGGGFLVLDNDGLRATPEGLQRLDAVLAALIA